MRDTLYRQMVYWIREYRTWIEVVDDNFYKEYALSRNGYINYIVSRTLVLRACKDKGSYAKVIILLATHNIVQLELMISPIQIREKPYYL